MHVIDNLGRRKVSGGTSVLQFMGQNDFGASYRVQNGNFELANATIDGYHAVFFSGPAGAEQWVLGANEADANSGVGYMEKDRTGDSWRFFEGNMQLWNTTQSIWQTPYIRSAGGGPVLAIGTGSTVDEVGTCTIKTVTTDYTALSTDCTILVDATAGNVTVTLPAAIGVFQKEYNVKKIDSSVNTVTIDPNGSELIDGATTEVITVQWTNAHIMSNATAWFIL